MKWINEKAGLPMIVAALPCLEMYIRHISSVVHLYYLSIASSENSNNLRKCGMKGVNRGNGEIALC